MLQTKKIALIVSFFFMSGLAVAQSGNGKNDNGNQDPGGPRTNKLLPHGNIGIGTLTPSEKLEVVGNVLVSDHLKANEITAVGFNATNITVSNDLKVGNNILVDGNIGIGVKNPMDRLEVEGNIRVSQDVMADRLIANQLNAGVGNITTDFGIGNNLLVNGKIGLGVTMPTAKLDVAGDIKASTNLTIGQNAFVQGRLGLGVTNPAEKLEVAGNIKSEKIYASDIHAANAYFTGNIGIGVDAPQEKLQVNGNIVATGFKGTKATLNSLNSAQITNSEDISTKNLNASESIKAYKLFVEESAIINKDARIYGSLTASNVKAELVQASKANITGDLMVNQNGRIAGDLNVGGKLTAGTIVASELKTANNSSFNILNPIAVGANKVPAGYQMAVNGNMLTTTIEVLTFDTWPDYVFTDEYSVLPLEEVSKFIKQHGHLPNIPSAVEIKKDGYSLSEMDAKLLEKIEELTLHMIELKNENKLLRKELKLLQENAN